MVALVVALRRQRLNEAQHVLAEAQHGITTASADRDRTRLFNERFGTAAKLLGDKDSAAVRLSGVYALAGLADDWEQGRQSCIDVLCGYLRLPYHPDGAASGEREVRLAVLTVIRDHLRVRLEPGSNWHGHDFDLRGAVFDGGDLNGACVIGGALRLAGARFVGAGLSWQYGHFENCDLDGVGVVLDGGDLRFDSSTFNSATVDFSGSEVTGGDLSFRQAAIAGGRLKFGLTVDGGLVCFDQARITVRQTQDPFGYEYLIDFSDARLTSGRLSFARAVFDCERDRGGGEQGPPRAGTDELTVLGFRRTAFRGADISFVGAQFNDGSVAFTDSVFDGSEVLFTMADFREGLVSFTRATLNGGSLAFRNAQLLHRDPVTEDGLPAFLAALHELDEERRRNFQYVSLDLPPATLDFTGATLNGGTVDFTGFAAAGGVVDLKGARLADATVRFAGGDMGSLLVVLWRMSLGSGEGSIRFEGCEPRLLLSENMTERERARIGEVPRWRRYEISTID